MANLVPLHIDKETGRIVARGGRGGGSRFCPGFLFEQLIPSATWTIPHNQKNDKVLVQIYETTGELILPNDIFIIDINTIQVTFGAAMEGTAHLIFFR